jgi:cation transport ATPase
LFLFLYGYQLKAKQAKFTRAMLVTAFAPIIYGIVFFVSTRILSSMLSPAGNSVNIIGIVIAFIAWIYVFKRGFKTGWIRALGISIVAIVVLVIIGIIIFFVVSQFVSHTQLHPSPPTPTVVPPMMPFQQV